MAFQFFHALLTGFFCEEWGLFEPTGPCQAGYYCIAGNCLDRNYITFLIINYFQSDNTLRPWIKTRSLLHTIIHKCNNLTMQLQRNRHTSRFGIRVCLYGLFSDNNLPRRYRKWRADPPRRMKEAEPTGRCWGGGGFELQMTAWGSRIAQRGKIARAAEGQAAQQRAVAGVGGGGG